MTEQQIQAKKIKQLEADGYYVIKLVRTNKNGIPDLIAIPPNSGVIFIEQKMLNKKAAPLQKYRMRELKKFGIKSELWDGEKTTIIDDCEDPYDFEQL